MLPTMSASTAGQEWSVSHNRLDALRCVVTPTGPRRRRRALLSVQCPRIAAIDANMQRLALKPARELGSPGQSPDRNRRLPRGLAAWAAAHFAAHGAQRARAIRRKQARHDAPRFPQSRLPD